MPSIQDFIEEFNRQILRQERKAASEMVRVYAEAWKRIKRRILALNAEYERMVADGIKPGPGWVYQSQRASELRAQISKELNTFSAFTEGKVTKLQKKAIEESLAYSEKLALMTLGPEPPGVRLGWVKVSSQAIINLVGANQASSPLYRLLRKIAVEGAEAAQDALVQGVILGHNPRKIAPMIRDALSIQLDRALKISRTEVLRAHREASQQSYKANDNIVKGWKWHSAADDRTCPSCWAMHGTEHPNEEKFSSHPNCRCTPVPLTYSWAEIGARYGVDLSEVDDIGGADTSKTGEELFRNLSPVEQQQILGKSLWQAWSEGKVEFDRLSVRTYSADWGEGKRAVTLKELGLNARELLEAFRKTIEEK